MLVPIEWLREFVNPDWSDEEIADRLTMAGLSVESLRKPFPVEGKILSAKVKKVSAHPNSERLQICEINDGENTFTTVTSDLSIKEGALVPIALPGTVLATGETVSPTQIRGVVSEIVMCSLQELGLEEKSDHIYQIKDDLTLGTDLIEHWKLNDMVLDIEVTPNRPDCLGIIGVARDLSALCKIPIKRPGTSFKSFDGSVNDYIKVVVEDKDGCPRYCAVFVKDVSVKPSPIWMRRRLLACGLRPINSVVDATNYVMLETGHPVHAFDYSKVAEGRIVVRRAMGEETVSLLDEKQYEMRGGEILITDATRNILAVGGVMGASDSGVTESTKDLILEVAYFNPVRIRRTAKILGITSDSSYRFERGVDPNDAHYVIERLQTLIQLVSGGVSAQGIVDVYPETINPRHVELKTSTVSATLGMEVPKEEIKQILLSLGMDVKEKSDGFSVNVPTFRPDVAIEEDLVEEVGRIYGYERLKAQQPRIPAHSRGWSQIQEFRKKIRNLLIASGFDETVNLSFCPSARIAQLLGTSAVKLSNPLNEDMDCLRPSLLFGLVDSLAYNVRRQIRDVKLFEIAKIYEPHNDQNIEREKIGLVSCGKLNEDDYTDSRSMSFLTLRGILDEMAHHLNFEFKLTPAELTWLTPGHSARIFVKDKPAGIIGMLSNEFNKVFDYKAKAYYMELDLQVLFENHNALKPLKKLSGHPSVRRDISFLIPFGKHAGEIVSFLLKSSEYVEKAGISDFYKGKDIPSNTFSVTFYVVYRAENRSLTDDEVNEIFDNTVQQIEHHFGIKRRFQRS